MSAPIIESSTDISHSGTSFDVTKPTGLSVGDLLLALIAKDDDITMNPPGGWSDGFRLTTVSLACSTYAFYKVADAGDVAASIFTFTGDNEDYVGRLYRISNVYNATPIDAVDTVGSSGSTTTPQAPSINTVWDNSLVFAITGMDDDDIPYTLETGGWAEDVNTSNTTAGVVIGRKVVVTGGSATGACDFTTNADDGWHASQIAIRAANEAPSETILDYERGVGRGVRRGILRGV